MTINPSRSTAPIGDFAAKGADRPAREELRPSRAATPFARTALAREAEKVAAAAREILPAEQESRIPVLSARQLSIRKDPELDRVVVQVIDADTGEVVRQIPSEEWVRHLKRLKGAKGLFVDQEG